MNKVGNKQIVKYINTPINTVFATWKCNITNKSSAIHQWYINRFNVLQYMLCAYV